MIQANYLNIQDEQTSVRIDITDANTPHNFLDVARFLRVAGIPNNLPLLEERLMDEETTFTQEV